MGERLNASDICTRDVVVAGRNTSVNEAAHLMRAQHVGALVVVDETAQGRMVAGMLTDRDIVTAIVAQDVNPADLRVADAMSTDVLTARAEDSIVDLLGGMRRKGVRRVPVVDAAGVLLGLVALDDLLEVVAEELSLVAQAIESGRRREPVVRPPRQADPAQRPQPTQEVR